MPVHIADAVVPLLLDLSQFEQQMGEIESRIAALSQKAAQAGAAAAQAASSQAAAAAARPSMAGVDPNVLAGLSLPGIGDVTGLSTIPSSIAQATSPSSPSGSGWSLGEDLGASLKVVSLRAGGTPLGEAAAAGGMSLGDAMMKGTAAGVQSGKGAVGDAVKVAIDEAFQAGKQAAEIASPSARGARELGGPIMEGVGVGILSGTAGVTQAMISSLGFAFNRWKAATFGGTFVAGGNNLNVIANPGGTLGSGGSLGNWFDYLGQSIGSSFDIAQPTSLPMSSRVLMSNVPTGVRDFGQSLLSGLVGSILPGWAAGPLSDMLGTMFGLKPILTREAITAPSVSADAGGFADYPYGGGTIFNVQNNFNGNFTDVERAVSLGILQSARRLGVYI